MENEKKAQIIGAIVFVLGIVILLFVLFQALMLVQGAGDYFSEQFSEEEEEEGPSAQFSWSTNDLNVELYDESESGDVEITSWEWNFGDGESSQDQNPDHTYDSQGDYRVRLRVEDENGETSTAYGNVYVEYGNQDGGSSEPEFGESSFGFGNFMIPLAAALLVGILYLVMFLVGAALVKAGWNLIKPGPSTIKMKIKPKRLEVESAEQTPMYSSQPSPAAGPISAQPSAMYYPQQTPATAQASMQPMPTNPPPQAPVAEVPSAQQTQGSQTTQKPA